MTNKTPIDSLDLRNAPLEDLRAMQDKLSRYVEKRLEVKKQGALDEIKRIVQEHDLAFDEVVQVIRTTTRRGKAPAIYRNPENPRKTWSGKGDAPDWYANHPDPESLRIPGA